MGETSLREFLNESKHGIFVNDVTITNWGKIAVIDLWLWSPTPETGERFLLAFQGCSKIIWEHFRDEPYDDQAGVIGISIYEDRNPKEIVFHTDLFEIIIDYSEVKITKS